MKDLCDVEVPDERSVMTYVAEFFHKFSSEGTRLYYKRELKVRQDGDRCSAGREICRDHEGDMVRGTVERSPINRTNKNDFERRMDILLNSLESTRASWSNSARPTNYPEAIGHLGDFAKYKKTSKRLFVRERQDLSALYSNIQTKLRTYSLRAWEPKEGLRLEVRTLIRHLTDSRTWSSIGQRS